MNFLYNNKEIAIDLDKHGTMLIMSKDGTRIIQKLHRAKIEIIAKHVMEISGFEEQSSGEFSYLELHFFNVKEPS